MPPRYVYDGLIRQAWSIHKFTGKMRDSETGLDEFPARYYSSTQGRWYSPDWASAQVPVPYADLHNPQTLNLYDYVGGDPTNHADADGHLNFNPAGMADENLEEQEKDNQGKADAATAATQTEVARNQKETVVFSDNANPQAYQEKPGVTADRTVDYQAAQMDKKGNIDSHDIERHADLTLHEKLDPNSKTKNLSIADKPTTSQGVFKDYQEVPAGGSYRVLRDWKVDGNSARVLDLNTHKAYGYELTTLDANSKTPIKTEYTNVPPF